MPETMVQIPRNEFSSDVWSRPFSELLEMAKRGERGMEVKQIYSMTRESHVPSKMADLIQIKDEKTRREYLPPDVCLMRCGREICGDNDVKAFLHAQNW